MEKPLKQNRKRRNKFMQRIMPCQSLFGDKYENRFEEWNSPIFLKLVLG